MLQGPVFNVEPREVTARLDTSIVRAIMESGTPENFIRRAIERRLITFGDDFSSAQNLLSAVYEIQHEDFMDQLRGGDDDDVTNSDDYDADDSASPSSESSAVDLSPEWTCKICLDAEVRVVFLPCAHLVSCSRCAAKLRTCPMCRMRILRSIKTSYE